MQDTDYILTIKKAVNTEIKVKGSRFIGYAAPCGSEEKFSEYLKQLQRNYYDATHHCYGFRIRAENFRYSDAGEPNGTAGLPIFNAISHFNLQETMVVVIRYFGGTKLGTGGLTRAYYDSAFQVLESSHIIKKILWETLAVDFDYQHTNLFMNLLTKCEGKADNLTYDARVHGTVSILPSQKELFLKQIIDLSGNKILISDEVDGNK